MNFYSRSKLKVDVSAKKATEAVSGSQKKDYTQFHGMNVVLTIESQNGKETHEVAVSDWNGVMEGQDYYGKEWTVIRVKKSPWDQNIDSQRYSSPLWQWTFLAR